MVRVAVATPLVRPGAVDANVRALIAAAIDAARQDAAVVVFPELCVTGYTCADLFQQDTLLAAANDGIAAFLAGTCDLASLFLIGAPLAAQGMLFNAALVCQRGKVLGAVPKIYLPNQKEFYEHRWFSPGTLAPSQVTVGGGEVPFGTDLLFTTPDGVSVGVELCEDLWSPIPPSAWQATAGAVILCNLSASPEQVGKAGYRRQLISQQSARCLAAYAYSSAGVGESSTDLVFGGHGLIAENGALLAESTRFLRTPQLTLADVDVQFLQHERRQSPTFAMAVQEHAGLSVWRRVAAALPALRAAAKLKRHIDAHPFVPADRAERDERCREIFAIQSSGLATRLTHCGGKDVVIGLSGGLDSTLALLVCVEAFAATGLDRRGIHGITMPGFGTSARTLKNVKDLGRRLGIEITVIDITASCRQHLKDIGHDGKTGDIAYENTQARERTQVLMDKANMLNALVIGTGDLSELALGWCTYNGDHMSMYGVNAGVPKTLVRYLIEWVAENKEDAAAAATLRDILKTPISPELLPLDVNGRISQKTDSVIGPYELHDFFLYELVRRGSAPDKILRLAGEAFTGRYGQAEIRRWLELFIRRFFAHQFKRSCLPDGPKVGSICLSPRGDWRMPSDASADAWLARLPTATRKTPGRGN